MKKLSWFNKIVFGFNIVITVLTFVAYILPFLAPKMFPLLSVLTLILPLFLILNALFFIYWLLQLKRQVFLSGLVLLLGITFINKFYKFSSNDIEKEEKDFTVMSYNVRLFNLFDWLADDNVGNTILGFINDQNPDVLCIQEYSENAKVDLRAYKYKAVFMEGRQIKTGQAIFSKFPIFNSGDFKIPTAGNNVIFADIKRGKDTLRVYNIHLQSIKISPDVNEISEHVDAINQSKSQQLFNRIRDAFKKQEQQADILVKHRNDCKYPVIICGDMNNSPFSYVYRHIKSDLNDCFEDAGNGFGQTYKFKYYPARIDYIFASKKMKVKSFTTFTKFENSDHFPIMTRLSFIE
jgi:endonuclease/exonuclease/phosphatase family metal-dependent hydrolase